MDQQEAFKQFMQNPVQKLNSVGFNIPQGLTNPNDILNYLLSTNKITQEQCNQAIMQSRAFNSMFGQKK